MTTEKELKERDILVERLQLVQNAIKKIPGAQVREVRHFFDGQLSVNKKGQLRLPIALPADEMLHDPRGVDDVLKGRWKVVPLLVFVSAE